MRNHPINHALCSVLAALAIGVMPANDAYACSRTVYLGLEDTVITVRGMYWLSDLGSNLWAFPRGIQRDGAAGPQSIRWASK